MGKLNIALVTAIIAIIFALSAFALFAQKGSLQKEHDNLKARLNGAVTGEYKAKEELETVKANIQGQMEKAAAFTAELNEAKNTIAGLNSRIQGLLTEKNNLSKEIERLKALATSPPVLPGIEVTQ